MCSAPQGLKISSEQQSILQVEMIFFSKISFHKWGVRSVKSCISHSLVGQQMHDNKFCLAVIMFVCTHWNIINLKAIGPTAHSKVARHIDEKNWETDATWPNRLFSELQCMSEVIPSWFFWLGISYIHTNIHMNVTSNKLIKDPGMKEFYIMHACYVVQHLILINLQVQFCDSV